MTNLHFFNQDLIKKDPALANKSGTSLPPVAPGDTVKVFQKIKEGDKFRTQAFEGVVIARKHGFEPGATITVRKMSGGIGVEKIFPLYLPTIEKIEILKSSKIRRAKLYYIRGKSAKAARRKMKTRETKPEDSTPAASSAENKVVELK